jgi:hypothetical protein
MSFLSLKRALVAGGTVVVLGAAALGVTHAQTATPTPNSVQPTPAAGATPRAGTRGARLEQYLDALAKRLGITTDKLKQAMQDARNDAGLPAPGSFRRPGGPGRPGFGNAPGAPGGFGRGVDLPATSDAAAKAIGITSDQLRQELPGKSLTDVANAHKVDPKTVSDAIKAALGARFDQAVTNGRLTADQAAQAKQRVNTQVDQLMTRQFPQRPAGRPAGRPAQPNTTRSFAPAPAANPI